MNRKRLTKLLGKRLEYTAILGEYCENKERIIIKDIKHKSKKYADHCWIKKSSSMKNINIGDQLHFQAEAYMYNDKFNVRKEGLKFCKNFQKLSDDFNNQMNKETKDAKHSKQRTGYKKRYK